ncbi:MAG: DUF3137 domain-containing protein, partial [Pseudomonadota bacterium]|nr:DUF3137 domain-containing protein [Pseudomonadota bacterium]
SKEGSDNRFSQTGFDSPLSKATFDVLRAKRDLAALRLPSKRVLATRFSRSASRIEEKTVFHGLVVRTAVHKNFRGRTIILYDAGVVGNFGRALLQGLQRVNLEDPVFEQAFEVAASNQVEARYLLPPHLYGAAPRAKPFFRRRGPPRQFSPGLFISDDSPSFAIVPPRLHHRVRGFHR